MIRTNLLFHLSLGVLSPLNTEQRETGVSRKREDDCAEVEARGHLDGAGGPGEEGRARAGEELGG